MADMSKKICLVTGANSGIGKEMVLELAKLDAQVIMVCRNEEKGFKALQDIKTQTGSTKIDLLITDLSSQQEIKKLSETLHARYPYINVLINNAGVLVYKKSLSVDNIELTLATNHLAPFLLTQLLLDMLQKGAPARVINISSAIHTRAQLDLDDLQYNKRRYRFLQAYAQSKLLMNLVSFEFARRLGDSPITINCVHPGTVNTNFGSQIATNFFLKWIDKAIKSFLISSAEGAKTAVYLACAPEVEGITGAYFVNSKTCTPSALSMDRSLAKAAWDETEKLLK